MAVGVRTWAVDYALHIWVPGLRVRDVFRANEFMSLLYVPMMSGVSSTCSSAEDDHTGLVHRVRTHTKAPYPSIQGRG